MNLGLEGKLAVVVGATGNTGGPIAGALEAEGCKVIRLARKGNVTYRVDLMDSADVEAVMQTIKVNHGNPDIIVHVAGGSVDVKDAMSRASDWAKVWRLNIGAAIDINRAFLPAMTAKGFGRIVHLSSNAVKLAIGHAPYQSAKAALEGYVRAMGKEVAATGVTVNAVSPGAIYTEGRYLYSQDEGWNRSFWDCYLPAKRWGRGEDIAAAVMYLCSVGAGYVTGSILDVDGGMR